MTYFDVVGFGALNVDRLFRVNRIAKAEEESFITKSEETCGGSAANTIVGLARLGCKVGFIGKVAHDREGEMLVEDFCREGVDTEGIIHAEYGRSGVVMGFVDEKGERALYIDPGVNDTIAFNEVNVEYAFQTTFLHLTSFVGEKSFQAQVRLLEVLPEKVKVSLDPGALYARMNSSKLDSIMERTYVLMPNAGELALLTGESDYFRGTDILIDRGVKIVAVKLGSKGCYVTDGKEKHWIEPFKVKVADTTGAGDAFCAGFLHGLINGKDLYECGKLGNFVASRCIMKVGARSGLPRIDDLKFLG
ncbi:MAG: carbohydrate kinase family protein [Candidatus Bathycorpusculaceae bacterium]